MQNLEDVIERCGQAHGRSPLQSGDHDEVGRFRERKATQAMRHESARCFLSWNGEKVLLHLWFLDDYRPAHILKMQISQRNVLTAIRGRHYLVSYCGLDRTWNEWVPESSLRDCDNSSGGRIRERLSNMSVALVEASSLNWERGMLERQMRYPARGLSGRGVQFNVVIKQATMKLGFPQQLKYKLKNDEDTILNQGKLFTLPRTVDGGETTNKFWLFDGVKTFPWNFKALYHTGDSHLRIADIFRSIY
ncbi:hypothetical protein R3P38DRAFT_2772510 [Favolaschia claudopus]|uniref:Tudor-knot domain-containing protein n=1 Tax=Favolaschia claudopus TaxID=2862362 RepID=A0AAW0C5W8_9AGAR